MSQSSDSFAIPKSAVRTVFTAAAAVVILVILAVLFVALARAVATPADPVGSAINPNEYQAVFLTNGQTYFGKLTAPGGDFYYLRKVYYLAQQKSLQTGKPSGETLVKLGNEIHGPEDLMVINRKAILFIENLKPTGKVSQAINHSAP